MVYNFSEQEKWEIVGYVKVSKIRYEILKSINTEFLMPKEIAEITGYKSEQISKSLHSLKEKKLVFCVNERLRKGRLYQSTELGLEVLSMIDELETK